MLGLVPECHSQKIEGGAKLIAKKIEFLRFCARISFLARAKILRQPLITYKTFVFDRFSRLFPDCSRLKMGLAPPNAVLDTFVLARIQKKAVSEKELKTKLLVLKKKRSYYFRLFLYYFSC